MKFNRKQMAILYKLILDGMERVDRSTPIEYVEDLQSLELLFSKEYDKNR